jgi:hypothetical protein
MYVCNHILEFVKACSHTNIILLNVPHMHDLMKSSCINEEITRFNRQLAKCKNFYDYCKLVDVEQKRDYFTKHDLHLNGSGKNVMAKQLVCQIYDTLFKDISIPVSLGWKNDGPNQDLMRISSDDDEIGSCLDALSPTNLNCDHPPQNHVLTPANPVTNKISNSLGNSNNIGYIHLKLNSLSHNSNDNYM